MTSPSYVATAAQERSSCSRLLAALFAEMNARAIPYCVVGSNRHALHMVPDNDVDIICAADAIDGVNGLISVLAARNGLKLAQILQHENGGFYNVLWSHDARTERCVRLDICTDVLRRGRLFLTADWLLEGRRALIRNDLIVSIAAPDREFAYYLLKKIDKGHADELALGHLAAQFAADPAACRAILRRYWPSEAASRLERTILSRSEAAFAASLTGWRRALNSTLPRRSVRVWSTKWRRRVKRAIQPTGLVTAILGPDGSGKSTLLSNVPERCTPAEWSIAYFHLIPPVTAKEGRDLPVTDPHARPTRNTFLSTLKLIYLVCRNNIGWMRSVFWPYRRSTMIYFDRYYHDMLVDAKRYRMGAPVWLVRFFGSFVPTPDLFLVLDVRPEVARKRKMEVSEEESQRQFHAYRALVKELPCAVLIDANGTPDAVAAQCEKAIVETMARRLKGRKAAV